MEFAILEGIIAIYLTSHFISLIALTHDDYFAVFNPVRNYKTWTSMNWFGVILGTIMLHVLLPVYAIGYWLYKLCTFGRKNSKG